jgi:NAD(P)-dependent dehydrogenase (short-subunit alcohol dehydrogenase family)
MSKVAIVTGGTSGIGLATAKELLKNGCTVYEFSRRDEGACPDVVHIKADVTKEDEVRAGVEEVVRREGRIDILVNNAGFGISGAIEFTPASEAKRQLDVNFFGMVNMDLAVLPVMRQQKSGRIVCMSSVAAPIPIPFQAYYSASKAAVKAYTLALANEVRPFGIECAVIMPGDIHTGFTAARQKSCAGDDVYGGRISRSVAVMEHDETTGISPEAAGAYVAHRALQKNPPPVSVIGGKYALAVFATRFLSNRFLNKAVGDIYAK